jgi:hypothetical protein
VLVTVASGLAGWASLGPARRFGRPCPSPAGAAWLLNGGRTLILTAGDRAAKITVSGPAGRQYRDVLPTLAETAAGRLADESVES